MNLKSPCLTVLLNFAPFPAQKRRDLLGEHEIRIIRVVGGHFCSFFGEKIKENGQNAPILSIFSAKYDGLTAKWAWYTESG